MRTWDNSKPTQLLRVEVREQVRANLINGYVRSAGYGGAVIFSCGTAAKALKESVGNGFPVVEVGPSGGLQAGHWWSPEEINKTWPALFDASSGHLPLALMVRLAWRLAKIIGELDENTQYLVPTGSGETILCLGMAYPKVSFCAVYDNHYPATTQDFYGPLNMAVAAEFPVQYWHGQL